MRKPHAPSVDYCPWQAPKPVHSVQPSYPEHQTPAATVAAVVVGIPRQEPITPGAVIGASTFAYHCNNCGLQFNSSTVIPQCPQCISYDIRQVAATPIPQLELNPQYKVEIERPSRDQVVDHIQQRIVNTAVPVNLIINSALTYESREELRREWNELHQGITPATQVKILSEPFPLLQHSPLPQNVLPLELGSAPKHVIIEALAGTGKTFTIIEACYRAVGLKRPDVIGSDEQEAIWSALPEKYPASSVYMVAFNRNIAKTLMAQVPPRVIASTAHGFGKRILGFHKMGTGKYGVYKKKHNKTFKILAFLHGIEKEQIQAIAPYAMLFTIAKLVSLMKLNLVVLSGDYVKDQALIKGLTDTHGMTLPEFKDAKQEYIVYSNAINVYEQSSDPKWTKVIDFDDMVWLPWKLNLTIRPYELMFVDERQDLNKAQQELVYQNSKRLVMVGDSHQAIYGFAGADVNACEVMESRLTQSSRGSIKFPLTFTRRCSKAVVHYNQSIVPEFRYFAQNQEGGVYKDRESEFLPKVSLGDMVVCRTNAPLFSCCLRLMQSRTPFKTTIKQFFEDTISLIKSFDCKDLTELLSHLLEWQDRKLEQCTGSRSDLAIVVNDQVEAIKVAIDNSNSVKDLINLLETVFKAGEDDDEDRAIGVSDKWIFLSSIHQAKGLEAKRVWWLQYDLVPHPKARLLEQETNLRWVAGTRAIDDLILVKSTPKRSTLESELNDE